MKHGYSKNRAVTVPDTFWVLVLLGTSAYVPQAYPNFSKKKKNNFHLDVTKIDKSNESSGNMNFRCTLLLFTFLGLHL